MSSMWQISAVGTFSTFVIVLYCFIGSSVALADNTSTPQYNTEECTKDDGDFAAEILAGFGSVIYQFGFHPVLPGIQTSLVEAESNNVHKDMKKERSLQRFRLQSPLFGDCFAWIRGFWPDLLISMTFVLPKGAMYVVWTFVIIYAATGAAVYNQSAFGVCRDILGITKRSYDIVFRVIWVVVATLIAMYIPFFGDLTAIAGALSATPLSFVYPMFFWNKKHKHDAPKWRIRFHYVFISLWITVGEQPLLEQFGA